MALYVSAARRLRRTIVTAAVVGLAALVIGWAVGRQQVPSIDERVTDVQQRAADLATNVERLDIEYEQVVGDGAADGTDTVEEGVIAPLDELRTQLQDLMDDAPWLGTPQRSELLDAVAEVRAGALDGVALTSFEAAATAAGGLIRTTFGVTA